MLNPVQRNEFKRDVKRVEKRGKNLDRLEFVVLELLNERPLDLKYRDHPLIGRYKGDRGCHIEPDWVLIYTVAGNDLILVRTGTHSDLYG